MEQTDLELFDLSQDIDEQNDLRIQRPEVYASLKQELIDYFDNIKAEDPGTQRTELSWEQRQKIRREQLKTREANWRFSDRNP